MGKSTHSACNFTAGEWSPRGLGRWDLAKYANAAKIIENFLLYQLGGALFRPGTTFVAETKDSLTARSRLIPFQYSTAQAYVIEMDNTVFRFFANGGVVGAPFELTTPFQTADLFSVQYTQSADTMYLVHPSRYPQKLTRLTSTTFKIEDVPFKRGPFLDKNLTLNTITATNDKGNTPLAANASVWAHDTSYINGPDFPDFVTDGGNTYKCLVNHVSNAAPATFADDLALGYWVIVGAGDIPDIFQAGHAGALFRIKKGVVKILTVTNGYTATAAVQSEPDGTVGDLQTLGAAQTDWSEGAFSAYRGYPTTVSFHEQRIIYANTAYQPQTFWGSTIMAYDNFLVPATVTDDSPLTFTIASGQVNAIRFISSGPAGIEMGTSGGTFSNSSGTSITLTPTNPNVHQDTNNGVAPILPKRISSYLYYIRANLFQLLELVYDWLTNREKATDMTLMADHILRDGGGAIDMAYQMSPNDRIWIVREDGQMAVFTRNAQQEVMGWSRIVAGSDATGPGIFESVCTIQKDGYDDEVWVVVRRVIAGVSRRYVEYFTSEFFDYYDEPVRLDSSLSYDTPIYIGLVDNTDPCVVHTITPHGFAAGDKVKIDHVEGMTELNTNVYTVANPVALSFSLTDNLGNNIDATSFGVYTVNGTVRKMVTHFTGLGHLTGETVAVQVDGGLPATQQLYMVVGGAITLKNPAAVVHIGLPYQGTLQLLKMSDGLRVTAQTKPQRVYQVTLRVYQSLACFVGQDMNNMQEKFFGTPNTPMTHAPNLWTGDFDVFPDTWWDREVELIIQQRDPLPLLILAAIIRHESEEK